MKPAEDKQRDQSQTRVGKPKVGDSQREPAVSQTARKHMRKRKTRMGSLGGDRARIQGPRPRRTSARAKRSKSKVRLQPGRTRRNPGPPPWGASRLAPKSLPSQGCTSAPRAGQRVYLKRSPRPITAPQVRGCASCTSKSASALHLEHGWPPRAVPTRMYLKLGRYPRKPRPRNARGELLRGSPSAPRWTGETWCRKARSSCCVSNLTHFANGQRRRDRECHASRSPTAVVGCTGDPAPTLPGPDSYARRRRRLSPNYAAPSGALIFALLSAFLD